MIRLTLAASFAVAAGLIAQFSWVASARTGPVIPMLSLSMALAHALAAAAFAPRIVRQPTVGRATAAGAATSAAALLLFTPFFAAWVDRGHGATSAGSAFLFDLLVGFFMVLAGGWAFIIAGAALGSLAYRLSR
jgi:hypothetical protein